MTGGVRAACVVVAAGAGTRLRATEPKALVRVAGRTLVEHAVRTAVGSGVVDVVVVAAPAGRRDDVRSLVQPISPRAIVVEGGAERSDSVGIALRALERASSLAEVVLVHDAARCLAPSDVFVRVVEALGPAVDAVVPGIAVPDTIKTAAPPVGATRRVLETLPRHWLVAVQTPQAFRRGLLVQLHAASRATASPTVTDDAMLVEAAGGTVLVVDGSPEAFKITGPLDVLLAEAVLAARDAT